MKINMIKTINSYKGMTLRNIRVYLKNKTTIIMSLMAQIIILGLFLLFLKNNYTDAIIAQLGELKELLSDKDINAIVNSYLMAGVIGTSVVTVALNSLSVMVSDKENKINFDYGAAPVKDHTVVLSYFSGAVANTFLVSAILTTAGFLFLCIGSEINYTLLDFLKIYGLVALGAISATLVLMVFASFFKKSSTQGSFGVLVSAAIGFITGAYIPVSQFSDTVQTCVNLVPSSQITGMIKHVLITPTIEHANDALGGIDNGQFAKAMKEIFSVNMKVFENDIDFSFMLMYSIIAIAVFLIINLAIYKFTSKNK